ncbi:signaling mucin MSB2 [Biomphalaria pfeifferi]|uniref:Signaling mucin MSB2 n=1 Tax=Biomphalaria pfeifferi TaxID=112525 RepID=A0AAD8FMQ1_BIOPF|nr:signaling mucin MSB2 [Biomphalaria pfeifferi]
MKVLAVLVTLVSLVDCQNFTSPLHKSFDFNCPANHTIQRMTFVQNDTRINIWCKFEKFTLKCALTDYMDHYANPLNFTCPRGEVRSGMKSDYIDKLNKRKFKFYCCEVKNSKYFNCYNTPYQDSKEVKLKEGQVIERTRFYHETKNITKRHFRVCENIEAKCNVTDIDHGTELSGQQRLCVISQIKTLSKKTKNLTETINSVADYMTYLVHHGFKVSENITKHIVDIFSAFRNRTSDSDFFVDNTTFNQLVTLADIVTISMQDDLTDTPDQDYETTNSIVTSLESVMYALSNETKELVSIKNTVGVKLGTITQDIRIPEVNQSALEPFDNWIRYSKNGILLPKDALEDFTDISRYTIIVIKRGEQNATDHSQMNTSSIMSKPKIVSDVIAVSVGHSVTLKSPVTMTFRISNVTQFDSYMAPVKVVCVYLEMSLSGSVIWTDKGCFTEKSSDDQIICKCYHLTSFAVLMGSKQLPQHQALTVLTITGCGVSTVFLSITIMVYLYLWNFLCVFFNFLTQSLALYKSIFNKSGRARLEIFLPVTYITPLLIVGATALVNKAEGYGTSNFCWLSVNKGFIWSFLGPVILILLVNAAVLIAIIKTVQSTHSMLDKTHAERTMSAARTIVVLTPMFGLTWVFGFVSLVLDLVVIQYLFVLLNTLQGLFIFLFYCLRQRQVIQAIQLIRRQKQAQTLDTKNKRSTTSTTL